MTRSAFISARNAFFSAAFAGSLVALPNAQALAQRAAPSAVGLWEQADDNGRVSGWFYIYERDGGFYEGKIVKMFPRPGDRPNPVCTKCPGDQKNQPTLGLTLIKNMERKGRNYENGTIMDPRDGSVYQARMEVSPDGQRLMVRGFLGIDLFGQSQTWRRLPDSAMAEVANGALPLPVGSTGATSSGATSRNTPAPHGNGQPAVKR